MRKASLPITNQDLVLDVGSGSNPHPAADVLLEKYVDPRHRYRHLVVDRPTVLADACRMPFRDKAFDFIIAFHVLEHMATPEAFLRELSRVGRAGYIEAPNVLFERLVPYDVHLLEIMEVEGKLRIHKKGSARPDEFLSHLEVIQHNARWRKVFYSDPDLFHVRYVWRDTIQFEVVNPDASCDWFVQPDIKPMESGDRPYADTSLRRRGLGWLRSWYRFRKQRKVELKDIMVCPQCHGDFATVAERLVCDRCRIEYPLEPVPDFNRGVRVTE